MAITGSTRQARVLRGLLCAIAAAALSSWAALLAPGQAGATTTTTAPTKYTTGELVNLGSYYFTVQMPGTATGVLPALTAAATRIGNEKLPYVWGGGHGVAGTPSIGIPGPGYNGKRVGYDCSGAVAAVLEGAGLWPLGASVPNDAGVIQDLLAEHLIAKGAGTGPEEVTLYDDPGVHIFMNIDGRFFGTSDGGAGADAKGGPGWLDDPAYDVSSKAFKRYHFLSGVLGATSTNGLELTFSTDSDFALLAGFAKGDGISIAYKTSAKGTMLASHVKFTDLVTTTGVVASLGVTGQTFSVTLPTGAVRTFVAAPVSELTGLQVGDSVTVMYTHTWSKTAGTVWTAHFVTVTAAATVPTGSTPGSTYVGGSGLPG